MEWVKPHIQYSIHYTLYTHLQIHGCETVRMFEEIRETGDKSQHSVDSDNTLDTLKRFA